MIAVIELDVSTLEPPQPMHEICQALVELSNDQILHVTHRRKPIPLFEMLDDKYCYLHREIEEGDHHIWFWHLGDRQAEQQVKVMINENDRA